MSLKQDPLIIEIFRAGTHTPMSGSPIAFSDADLAATAAAYDRAVHEAPIVLGHPENDDPAYGWCEGLECRDGGLYATLTDLEPAFAEAVKARRYDKRSPAFYAPNAKGNPTPGVWHLRHIGFLGAVPPGCKGLKPIAFSEEAEITVFAEPSWSIAWGFGAIADIFRRLREQLIEKVSVEEADKVYPEWSIRELVSAAQSARDSAGTPSPAFSEAEPAPVEDPQPDPEALRRAAELDERETSLKQREDAIATADAERVKLADAAFVEGLVRAGRLAPGAAPEIVAFIGSLDATEMVAFAEGASSTRKDAFKALLGRATPIISFSEHAPSTVTAPGHMNSEALAASATSYVKEQAAKGVTITTAEAVRHIQKGQSA